MPRDGSNIYHRPAGTDGVPNFPIESSKYNAYVADVEQDLNLPRPIVAGGSGANNATDALFNVKGEIATQIVTNWDSQVWVPGSFYAASTATGTAPVAGHNFAGQVYIGEALANPPTNLNVILEARDLDNATPPGASYVRQKKAGVWSAWSVGTVGTLTDAEKAATRQSIYAAPFDALAYNGMQINGSMEVSQEKGAALTTTSGQYIIDGWGTSWGGTGALTGGQGAFAATTFGLTNNLFLTTTTAQVSITAGDIYYVYQFIEGYRVSRLAWGTANAQPITIGFWTNHNRLGTYSVAIRNSATTRSYVTTYTQNTGTWEYKTVTIPGDITGTWAVDNSRGITISFALAVGSTFTAPSANTWVSGNYVAAPGQINAVAATSDVFRITGFVVLPGIEAPSAARSSLIMRPYDQEVQTCKRYWEKMYTVAATSVSPIALLYNWTVEKRASPILGVVAETGTGLIYTISNPSGTGVPTKAFHQTSPNSALCLATVTGDARL